MHDRNMLRKLWITGTDANFKQVTRDAEVNIEDQSLENQTEGEVSVINPDTLQMEIKAEFRKL